MQWISASNLEDWAKSIGSRTTLPKIVSDLIRASVPDLVSIRFPSGDKGQVRGFDGHVVSEVSALNVPKGHSFWEFGTTGDYQAKAKSDFKKRTTETPVSIQKETTYVYVSPCTWDSSKKDNKLEDLIADFKRDSNWKEIQYLDGVALESWLEDNPAVSAWHARETLSLYPVEGIRSTDEAWSEFAGQFAPPITEEVLLCERDEATAALLQELLRSSNTTSLVADSPGEALAFAIAAIRKAPPGERLFLEARTLIVDSIDAGRQLPRKGRLVLLLRNDAAKSPAQFSQVGTTFVPLGRQQRGVSAPLLVRPTAHAMSLAMHSMGLEPNRALTLARGSGRSLAALARLIPGGSYDPPAWQEKGQELLPAILAGAWDASNEKDRSLLQNLATVTEYSQIEARVRARLSDSDPPFDLEGSIWKVRAPMDAFVRVGPLIDPDTAARLRNVMHKVFAEIEPEPDPSETIPKARSCYSLYSEWLRDGLATTLLLLAVWDEVAEVNLGAETGQQFANRTLQELPGLRSDPRLLTSLKDQLPLLAEAAPGPFMSALECLLEGDGAAILPIFNERGGLLFSMSQHAGVLWALETLAWDPEYFHRAVMILVRLAAIDPGGRLTNRPVNSLAEIFVLWNPNTNASWAQQLASLDEIAQTYAGVAWKLILKLLPSTHAVSTPTAKPQLREAGAEDRKRVTTAELRAHQATICQRAVTLAGNDPDRWFDLVGRITAFYRPERELAFTSLDRLLEGLQGTPRKLLWTKVREEVRRHERFKAASWALPDEDLTELTHIVEKYTPSDFVERLVPLFDDSSLDVDHSTESEQRRAEALVKLYENEGAEAVARLAKETRNPYLVVEAASRAGFSAKQLLDLLTIYLAQDVDSSFTRAISALYRTVAGEAAASSWLQELLDNGAATPETAGALIQLWPDGRETWQVVRRFGREVVDAYWTKRIPRYITGSKSDLLRSNLMLLRYGRALEAIQSSLNRLQELPTKLLLRMLDGVIPELNSRPTLRDTMSAYYVEKAFEALDLRRDATENDIAVREYQMYPLLQHSDRQLRIYHLMARDPGFFHQILRNVYLAEGEEKSELDSQTAANATLSFHLLSNFSLLPGLGGEDIDWPTLAGWIDEFRRLGVETNRRQITDSYVGRILAHAPPDPDGAWPHTAVRQELERLASDEIERGVQIERYNMRGSHSRGLYEGGDQERKLAKTAFDDADVCVAWPRTAALLRAIGRTWEEEGKREDLDAAQRRLKY
jgi:hypothetical protein